MQGDVVARAWVLDATGDLTPLAAPAPRIAESGAVLIEGDVGSDVRLPTGESSLIVIVGRAAVLPDPVPLAKELGAAGQKQTAEWSAWAIPLRVE